MKKLLPYLMALLWFLLSPVLWILRGKYLNLLGMYHVECNYECNPNAYDVYSFLFGTVMILLAGYTVYLVIDYMDRRY